MNVLFLDFDEVINCQDESLDLEHVYLLDQKQYDKYCKVLAKNISKLCNSFDFKIVVSSSWRLHFSKEELSYILKYMGIENEVIGVTTSDPMDLEYYQDDSNREPRCRALQISKWLEDNRHLGIHNYFILDDSCDVKYKHDGHYYLVNPYTGFNKLAYVECQNLIKNLFNKRT